MKYVGLQEQKRSNSIKSILFLVLFPFVLLLSICPIFSLFQPFENFIRTTFPIIIIGVIIWFLLAYFRNTAIISKATDARPLERKEEPRVYNLVENLCIAANMDYIPKIYVVNTPKLNAYASGIDDNSYAITLTTGIINKLNNEELSGVIAHELTHILNKDTRLLVISIVFVGIINTFLNIFSKLTQGSFWALIFGTAADRSTNKEDSSWLVNVTFAIAMLFVLLAATTFAAIGYFFALLARFSISRKREFLADAGGAELCQNPIALASALRKISENPAMENIEKEDVAQLFIFHGGKEKKGLINKLKSFLFATHPDVNERIRLLEQF